MFYFLSKVLFALVAPMSVIMVLFLLYLLTKIKTYFYWAFGLILVLTNPFLSMHVMRWYEEPPKIINDNQKYDALLLPGGFISTYTIQEEVRVNFSDGNDRMMQAIDLFKRGVSNKIIYSAGADTVFSAYLPEADMGRLFLLKCGIPDSCIIVENKAMNTFENAVFTQNILKTMYPTYANKKFLLITAGFHMKRALACYEKAGIHCDSYATDLRSIRGKDTLLNTLVPSAGALENWTLLFKECIGIAVYKMVSYI